MGDSLIAPSPNGWRYIGASIIGTSHMKYSLPCQDAHACTEVEVENGEPVLITVVADGAGSACRSDEGARVACATSIEAVKLRFAGAGDVASLGRLDAEYLVQQVQARLQERATEYHEEVRELACTLLLAVIGSDAAFYLQIGDGGIVISRNDDPGGFGWVFWPESGEYINHTHFVTAADAIERMQTECARGTVDEVALFSDGIQSLVMNYATRTVHEPFFAKMFGPVRTTHAPGNNLSLQAQLASFLGSRAVSARTDDDCTLVLASRRGART